ncbi:MAG: hypothetical protein AB7V12_01230, partial [Candidatus Dadabacteria bacterium]
LYAGQYPEAAVYRDAVDLARFRHRGLPRHSENSGSWVIEYLKEGRIKWRNGNKSPYIPLFLRGIKNLN